MMRTGAFTFRQKTCWNLRLLCHLAEKERAGFLYSMKSGQPRIRNPA